MTTCYKPDISRYSKSMNNVPVGFVNLLRNTNLNYITFQTLKLKISRFQKF